MFSERPSAHGRPEAPLDALGPDHELTRLNPTRVDLVERFQKLLADYNAGSLNIADLLPAARRLSQALSHEDARALSEGLNEEQLAIFDLLTRPGPDLSADEEREVKKVARGAAGDSSSATSWSSTGARNSRRAPPCASPSKRPSTVFLRSTSASSTHRNATPSISTSSSPTGTTGDPCTTWPPSRRCHIRQILKAARADESWLLGRHTRSTLP